ncbi:uncharacterized protein F4822DRAFT_423445 [Hypoxylon trugodes]|uniref:uncharacterized protein n=1 Tax=Hypoxylon trugodes TaxID=326681 RepID=UPI00218F7F82|nr:uncharacterized protein F4822DRAFT_423445 [Hypoxylon trugodes]KAI1382592.1 hypothetical protein F4822DRAFT_423445 [Hypoxylon trugodes]
MYAATYKSILRPRGELRESVPLIKPSNKKKVYRINLGCFRERSTVMAAPDEHSPLLEPRGSARARAIGPYLFYISILALCFLTNVIPILMETLPAFSDGTIAFYLQSGIFNDWLHAILGPFVPPALESCVSVLLRCDLDPRDKKTSRKSKSLDAFMKSAMKLPTALFTIYRVFGNPWMFLVVLAFQTVATILSSQIANEAQDRRAAREKALEGDRVAKALEALRAVETLDVPKTQETSKALHIVQQHLEAVLASPIRNASSDALGAAKSEFTASLQLRGRIIFSRKLVLFLVFAACASREITQATLTSLSHRLLALDDLCDKIAENIPNTLRILSMMAEGSSLWSWKGIRNIHSNFSKACEANWRVDPMPMGEVPRIKRSMEQFANAKLVVSAVLCRWVGRQV